MMKSEITVKSRRRRAMSWSILFIVLSAMILPLSSYLVTGGQEVYAQAANESNQRANFWRAVREGQAGYSAVSNPEAGVLINNGGQNWRQLRNRLIANYGGWGIIGTLGLLLLFFMIRGRIRVNKTLSGKKIPRWNGLERFMHWYTAILFIVLAITGLSLLFGRMVLIPLMGPQGFAAWANISIIAHNYVGPFFSIGVFAMLLFWIKNNIPTGVDFKWFVTGGGIIGNNHPSAGKANGGEKLWFWIVILVGLVAVCGTGFMLIGWAAQWGFMDGTRATMQLAHQVHAASAIIWIIVFFGHAYIGTIGTEGALEGMTTGKVSIEWAQQHHDIWYEKMQKKTGSFEPDPVSPPSMAEAADTPAS